MEFWGIEVKPGQIVKCEAGDERILHLSQASLGESKKEKGTENVPIFIKVNDQKLVIGTLSADKCAQIQYDLVFEKDFELSHGSKNTSVYFAGYKKVNESDEPEDVFDDSSSEDEKAIGKPSKNEQGKSTTEKASAGKDGNVAAKLKAKMEKLKKDQVKADNKVEDKDVEDDSDEDEDDSEEDLTCKPSKNVQGKSTAEKASSVGKDGNVAAKLKANIEKLKKEQVKADNMEDTEVDDDSDEDEYDSEEDSDSYEDIVESSGDSSEEDEDDSSEEVDIPEKVETDKKRKADSASKTPIPEKKARVVTPAGNHKTGGDGKKAHVHVATPHPAKQVGKPQQSSKSCGSVTCKACNRAFNSENALQAHRKDKHGNAAK